MLPNWGSYVTNWGTKGLIQLYYLSFSASQVACKALCATDFILFYSLPFLSSQSSLLPSLHLQQHLPTLKRPAGQTDAGLDQSGKVIWDASCTQAHTHIADSKQHTPLLCYTLAWLPPLSSICIYFTKWILLFFYPPPLLFFPLSVWLRILNAPDHAQDVYISNFSFNFRLDFFPPPFCDVSVFQWDRLNFLTCFITALG